MKQLIGQESDILEFIPQRPPFAMIHRLHYSDSVKTISGLTVRKDNLFFQNGFLAESGMVENIAQTAAAGVGYVCKNENRKVPVGFIASIKDLEIYQLPPEGAELVTEAVITNSVMQVSIVKGKITWEGNIIAECEMRIFVKPDSD